MASSAAQDEFNALFNKGSYTTGKTHPEDRDSIRRSSSTARNNSKGSEVSRSPSPAQSFLLDDDDEDNTAEDLAVKAMRGTYYVPRAARQANTGPKGVIADAQAFEQARRQAQSIRSVARKPRQSTHGSPPAAYKSEEFSSGSDMEDDEQFLESWRQKRLLELNNRNMSNVLGRDGGKKKTYGTLKRVDAEGFLNAVEGSPADTVVMVLINDHTVCSRFVIKSSTY